MEFSVPLRIGAILFINNLGRDYTFTPRGRISGGTNSLDLRARGFLWYHERSHGATIAKFFRLCISAFHFFNSKYREILDALPNSLCSGRERRSLEEMQAIPRLRDNWAFLTRHGPGVQLSRQFVCTTLNKSTRSMEFTGWCGTLSPKVKSDVLAFCFWIPSSFLIQWTNLWYSGHISTAGELPTEFGDEPTKLSVRPFPSRLTEWRNWRKITQPPKPQPLLPKNSGPFRGLIGEIGHRAAWRWGPRVTPSVPPHPVAVGQHHRSGTTHHQKPSPTTDNYHQQQRVDLFRSMMKKPPESVICEYDVSLASSQSIEHAIATAHLETQEPRFFAFLDNPVQDWRIRGRSTTVPPFSVGGQGQAPNYAECLTQAGLEPRAFPPPVSFPVDPMGILVDTEMAYGRRTVLSVGRNREA
ncbi:hypothetical protein B0T20DRAFT_397885 [Sordaria brevicollis]|uniref:Uncharacterized protein n=1 Tax=Sordaria brevicollis TaxID=83679 RepID=A0AAE0U2D4_SORBR|nr:hypothetical protein B0T20DRAFT_397885 [Sordaria brevicollis]